MIDVVCESGMVLLLLVSLIRMGDSLQRPTISKKSAGVMLMFYLVVWLLGLVGIFVPGEYSTYDRNVFLVTNIAGFLACLGAGMLLLHRYRTRPTDKRKNDEKSKRGAISEKDEIESKLTSMVDGLQAEISEPVHAGTPVDGDELPENDFRSNGVYESFFPPPPDFRK